MGRIVFFLTLIAAGLAIALFVFDGGVPTGGQTYAQSSGNFGLRQTTSPDASTRAAFAFGGACRAMLLCGAISMSAGSFFALFEQAGSDAVSSWPLN